VATEVAARGIDVADVAHVVNYGMPCSIDSYTHRIGRTGRAGRKGVATSFLTLEDTDIFFDLKQMLVQSNSPVQPELAKLKASQFKPGSVQMKRHHLGISLKQSTAQWLKTFCTTLVATSTGPRGIYISSYDLRGTNTMT
jgi:superfamily II DNA/RNA helicase